MLRALLLPLVLVLGLALVTVAVADAQPAREPQERRELSVVCAPPTDPAAILWERPDGARSAISGSGHSYVLRRWFAGAGMYQVGYRGTDGLLAWTAPVELRGRELRASITTDRNGYIALRLQSRPPRGVRFVRTAVDPEDADAGVASEWMLENGSSSSIRVPTETSGEVLAYIEVWNAEPGYWACMECTEAIGRTTIEMAPGERRPLSRSGLRPARPVAEPPRPQRIVVEMNWETVLSVPLGVTRVDRATVSVEPSQ